jgi:hypothetical protein
MTKRMTLILATGILMAAAGAIVLAEDDEPTKPDPNASTLQFDGEL